MQVLIVDSSLPIIQRLEELLSESTKISGIYSAVTLHDALQLFKQHRPAMVVLDLNLPGNRSYELLRTIKDDVPTTVVIIVSIHIDEYTHQQCMAQGANYFFDKYHEFERIPQVINANAPGELQAN